MKSRHICLFLFILIPLHLYPAPPDMTEILKNLSPVHPRILLPANEEAAWREKISGNPFLQPIADKVISDAKTVLDLPPVKRIVTGRRLLDISRIALKRIIYLSFAYRLSGETKYANRAIEEMRAVSEFKDWNPSHFLDVAEMTTAMAIGYDWLYPVIKPEDRKIFAEAILGKGLRPSFPATPDGKPHWFVNSHNNWNQVCNGGMTLGALAVYEEDPALAEKILQRAVKGLPHVIKTYAPDGAYVEGAVYWSYGTTFNILFLDAVEKALGTDFGLGRMPGFMQSADYMQHITGPSGHHFNYADSGKNSASAIQPGLYWMAQRKNTPSLLWQQIGLIDSYLKSDNDMNTHGARFTPFILLWAPANPEKIMPALTHWKADGKMPVAFHRSDWGPAATYVAIKGGSPSLNHAHMDVGSFVLEMNGVRWAVDLGAEDYHEAEKRGIKLWDRSQHAERWKIFRLGSFGHNIFTINGEQQRVDGQSNIISSTGAPEQTTTVNLTSLYQDQLASARRSVRLPASGKVVIEDQLTTLNQPTRIHWAMLTNAEVDLSNPQNPVLKQKRESLHIQLKGLENIQWQVKDVSTPPQEWESINPNTRVLFFESQLHPESELSYAVEFLTSSQNP